MGGPAGRGRASGRGRAPRRRSRPGRGSARRSRSSVTTSERRSTRPFVSKSVRRSTSARIAARRGVAGALEVGSARSPRAGRSARAGRRRASCPPGRSTRVISASTSSGPRHVVQRPRRRRRRRTSTGRTEAPSASASTKLDVLRRALARLLEQLGDDVDADRPRARRREREGERARPGADVERALVAASGQQPGDARAAPRRPGGPGARRSRPQFPRNAYERRRARLAF